MKEEIIYRSYSSKIIQMLVKRGYTLTQIAMMADVTKSYMSRVNAGTRGLTLDHLVKLEIALGEPLPLLWVRSIPISSVPKEVRPLYRATKKLMKKVYGAPRRKNAAA